MFAIRPGRQRPPRDPSRALLRRHLSTVPERFGSGGAIKEYAPWKGAGTIASPQETLVEPRPAPLEQLQILLLEADLAVMQQEVTEGTE